MLSISILLDPNTGRIAALKTKIEEQQVTIDNLTEQQIKLNNKLNLWKPNTYWSKNEQIQKVNSHDTMGI